MANYADSATDLKLAQMEKRITRIYKDASDDLQKRANDYFSSFAARYEKEYDAYLEGKYTDAQFKAWYYAQVGRGERWQTLKTDMAKRMTKANQIAAAYVNDNTPGIYTLNANFAAYEIETGTGIAFNLVNEQTVKNLMEGKNFTEFRTLSVNPKRDYNWNTQKIQDALLSGILQGDSIKTLTGRYLDVMGMNRNAAIRNARTAVTSAQNGGRQSTFNKAKAMGIDMQKEWVATNDSRTRDSHRELDGVRVENEDPFPNGCMFPGDPGGEPAEVYNCRCTMRAILPRYNGARRTNNTKASYKAWVSKKAAAKLTPGFKISEFREVSKFYSVDEAKRICEEMGKIVDTYIDIPSKWSGNIVRRAEGEYAKLWNCDIATGEETCAHILMHENIHSRSASYYPKEYYIRYWRIEESSVQLLTQEISAANGVPIIGTQYDDYVNMLREVGRMLGYTSDIEFAKEVISQGLPERMLWLRDKALSYYKKNGSVADLSRVNTLLDALGEM